MFSFLKSFFTLSASASASEEQGGPVSPAALATTETAESSSGLVESGSTNGTPSSEGPMSAQSNSTIMTGYSSRSSEASTDTGSLADSARTSSFRQTTSNASTVPPTVQDSPRGQSARDIDCMVFDSNSYVGSPTLNIDSDEATGATNAFPEDQFRPQRPSSARVYPSQTTYAMSRERGMYFGPGTVAGSPTLNIRSLRATGAMEQVVPSRS
ncbi:hypothetical protein DFH29DRAFT_933698 [Suillus ampliporus]|nr:hypothetical protein DFH29DRAFT_933698 [Suillus ampliporus]